MMTIDVQTLQARPRISPSATSLRRLHLPGRSSCTSLNLWCQAGLRKLLAPGQPLPMEYVFTYIKAFYLPADEILEWSRAHPEYTVRHITGLVSLTGVNTQTKKKLISALEKPA